LASLPGLPWLCVLVAVVTLAVFGALAAMDVVVTMCTEFARP
jgi:hypothetical protein